MAATGYTPIYLYYSSTATNQPSAGNLGYGELAINITDKNLFFKDNTNAVNTVPLRQASGSSNGWLSSTDWTTFNSKQAALVSGTNIKTVSGTSLLGSGDVGTIGTGYGGTGLTSFTANEVFYASSTSAFAQSANLKFNGSNLGIGFSPYSWAAGTAVDCGAWAGFGQDNNGDACVSANSYNDGTNWRYKIGALNSGLFYVSPSGDFSWRQAGAATANAIISYTSTMTLNTNGGLQTLNTIGVGNATPSTSGAGISFPASQSASTDANTLDDYEEGTWTPAVTLSSGSPTVTYTTQFGSYTKVGRQVTVTCYLVWSAASGGGTGDFRISGFPFATANIANQTFGAETFVSINVVTSNDSTILFPPNTTVANPNTGYGSSGVGYSAVTGGSFSKYYCFTLSYFTST